MFDGSAASLSVVNQTSTVIRKLSVSTSVLLDGKTGERIPATAWEADFDATAPLSPNQRTDCRLPLTLSNHAGAYTGTLRIDGDSGFEGNLPLTIRIRGPYFPVWRDLPLIFLTIVFGVGWSLSMTLDYWFTVKRPLLDQVVTLKQIQTALAIFLSNLAKWEQKNGITLINTDIAVTYDKSDLDGLLLNLASKTVADMQQAVERFTTSSALNDEFYTAIELSVTKIPLANLAALAKQLDAVSRNQSVAAYRTALLSVLTAPPAAPALAAIAPPAFAFQPGGNLSKATVASLHRRAVLMDWLKMFVVAVVVWLTAYTVYYAPNPSFGTSLDYIALFLWCLGLTATGSQIISTVPKP